MAKRKATKRTRRRARGGAILQPDITPEFPGVTIRFDTGTVIGVYVGPGGAKQNLAKTTPGSGSGAQMP